MFLFPWKEDIIFGDVMLTQSQTVLCRGNAQAVSGICLVKYIHCKYIDTLEALFFFCRCFFFSGHAPCTNDVSIVLNVLNVVRSLKAPMGLF